MGRPKKSITVFVNPKHIEVEKANDALGAAARKRNRIAGGTPARQRAQADVAAAAERHRQAVRALWGRG